MMRRVIRFRVSKEQGPLRSCVGIATERETLLQELASLGYERNPHSGLVTVMDPEGSPRLTQALKLIQRELGMRPTVHKIVKEEEGHQRFAVQVERRFSKSDVENARWLVLWPKHAIATMVPAKYGESGEYVVEADARLRKSKSEFGSLYYGGIACSDRMRPSLEAAGLKGLSFRPVSVEPPEKSARFRRLWGVWSHVVLPPNLYPLVDGQGDLFDGDWFTGCFFDDGGNAPSAPRYRMSDLEQIGDFDVAVTSERTGTHPGVAFRKMIVTQNFRAILGKMSVKGLEYWPLEIEG